MRNIGPAGKPRRPEDGRMQTWGRRRRRLAAMANQENRHSGGFVVADRSAKGYTTGVVFGVTAALGGRLGSPAHQVAWRIRKALAAPPKGVVTVYDAQGKAVATIDPVTRVRTPLPAPETT